MTEIQERLEYLRSQINAECISYGEIAELQGYAEDGHIDSGDVQLLEWAGVPEFADSTPIKDADPRYVAGVSAYDDDMTDDEWVQAYGN